MSGDGRIRIDRGLVLVLSVGSHGNSLCSMWSIEYRERQGGGGERRREDKERKRKYDNVIVWSLHPRKAQLKGRKSNDPLTETRKKKSTPSVSIIFSQVDPMRDPCCAENSPLGAEFEDQFVRERERGGGRKRNDFINVASSFAPGGDFASQLDLHMYLSKIGNCLNKERRIARTARR